jgi:tryptophanyl-tRNA synthetase
MRIVTDSRGRDEPKDPGTCTVFALYRLLADPAAVAAMRAAYLAGGIGYGEAKQALADLLDASLEPARSAYEALLADPGRVDDVLRSGAEGARAIAAPLLDRVRDAVGLGRRAGPRWGAGLS